MMLKVTVDLHPGGISEFRRTLATMTVSNVTDLSDVSDYEITATEDKNVLEHEIHDSRGEILGQGMNPKRRSSRNAEDYH